MQEKAVANASASGTTRVQGAVFGADTVRLTRIGDFRMEAVPEGYILMLHNRDVPGVVGKVGTILGRHQVNIGNFALGRKGEKADAHAIAVVQIDSPAIDAALK